MPVGVFLQTGANALDTRAAVEKNACIELKAKFPPGLTYSTPYDTTPFVSESINEVLKTLAEAMVLVFIVVYLFLQSWRATIIPYAGRARVPDWHHGRPAPAGLQH